MIPRLYGIHVDNGSNRHNGRIKVLIADDHRVLGEGLKLYLSDPDLKVVGVAMDGVQAIDMVIEKNPDVLLLDLRMPRMDGFEALAAIKEARPETNVIILTGFASNEHLTEAFRLGASGFLSKTSDPAHIPGAIRVVAAGDAIVDRELLQGAMRAMSEPVSQPIPNRTSNGYDNGMEDLTKQESRVLALLATGLENQGIAERLHVSNNTVKTHIGNIYSKLGVNGRTQAAIWAVRNGLAD